MFNDWIKWTPKGGWDTSGADNASKFLEKTWKQFTGEYQTEQANKTAIELANYQRDWEAAQVDKMNAYNSPKAQMQRYKEAGLNPNLIYGQGTPGNQTLVGRYSAPDVKAAPRVDYLGMVLQALQGYQQILKTKTDTDYVLANTQLVNQEQENKVFDLHKSKSLFPYQQELAEKEVSLKKEEISKLIFENAYREKGINPNDPMPYRVISRFIDWLFSDDDETQIKKKARTTFGTTGEKIYEWKKMD